MVGKLFIDGVDAFSEYGVFVEQYGYHSITAFSVAVVLMSEWKSFSMRTTA